MKQGTCPWPLVAPKAVANSVWEENEGWHHLGNTKEGGLPVDLFGLEHQGNLFWMLLAAFWLTAIKRFDAINYFVSFPNLNIFRHSWRIPPKLISTISSVGFRSMLNRASRSIKEHGQRLLRPFRTALYVKHVVRMILECSELTN